MTPLKFDPKTTAFVIIDLQNAIVGRDTKPHSAGDVVKRCAAMAAALREKKSTVVYVNVDLSHFVQVEADSPSRDPNAPPPPASASELVPDCGKTPQDLLITKRHWSAFPHTALEQKLRSLGIKTIILGGIATNFGVESTARDAAALGFNVIFAEDAMTSMSDELHRFAVNNIFPRLGRVRTGEQILSGAQ